jgi:membrane fusion protein (multidrug efflux system)
MSEADPSNESSTTQAPTTKKRSRALLWFTLLLIVLGIAWFIYWDTYLKFHQTTDDAYANGNLITLNSAISGSVTAFFADDTDLVMEGQLLVTLDPTQYITMYEKELGMLASTVLQVRQLFDTVQVNQAAVEAKRAALEKATFDFKNRERIVASRAISTEDFEHAKNAYLIAQLDLKQVEAQLEASLAAAGSAPIQNHPLIEQQKSNVRAAFYNLAHCSIYAPATGYVAQRGVEVGQWITSTTSLMSIIPTNYMWVDANFKETQLTQMRLGQPANVWFDIYGSKVNYQGQVVGIGSGTGSVFSLIPPQNATGNWIKIVQRLPVRISLDPETLKQFPLRLGLSATVDVDITNQDLPLLAQNPSTQPIGSTNVFNIHMQEADRMIEEVIAENLKRTQN